jgi:Bbp16-like protein
MILDGLLQFTGANGDSPTATAVSTNVIDLHMAGIPILASGQGARDMGIGDDPALKLLVLVTATFAGLTSLQVALQGATDDGTGNPATFNTWWTGPAVALASLTAGARLYDMDMPRPPAGIAVPRFLRMNFIIAGTGTGGTIKAFIVLDRDDHMYQATNNAIMGGYPPGVVVAN